MTFEDIKERHKRSVQGHYCETCGVKQLWPCDAARLLAVVWKLEALGVVWRYKDILDDIVREE